MDEQLKTLYAELEEVQSCPLDYLPRYGYQAKEEVIQLIKEDIEEVKLELAFQDQEEDCDDEELEAERTSLCMQLGIPRYC